MKSIRNYKAEKYDSSSYVETEPDIYVCDESFVTSLCFEQEPEFKEGTSAADISQYPLEDVLDRFHVFVSDFYDKINVRESQTCYLELCGDDIEDIRQLRSMIGKHVYNKEADGVVNLVVEETVRVEE